jgi:hypothetical protein
MNDVNRYPVKFQKSKRMIGFLLVALIVGMAINEVWTAESGSFVIETEVHSSQKREIYQIFYDIGYGYREQNANYTWVVHSQQFDKVSIKIPVSVIKNIRRLRFDPGVHKTRIAIKSMSLKFTSNLSGKSETISRIEPEEIFKNFQPVHHITDYRLIDGVVMFSSTGNDPSLFSSKEFAKKFLSGPSQEWLKSHKLLTRLARIFFSLLILVVSTLIYIKRRPIIESCIWFTNRYLFENPEKTEYKYNKKTAFILNAIVLGIFIWFGFQIIYFASHIKYAVSPDESHHFWMNRLFYQTRGFFLKDGPGTYSFGTVSTIPYLYHLILGKLLHFNVFGVSRLAFWRGINVFLSLSYFIFAYLLVREITSNKIIHIASLVVQSNLLMFVFLSGMISYDNLVNLLGVISSLCILLFLKTRLRIYLWLVLITMMVGGLTKITYLPLIIIQFVVILPFLPALFRNAATILSPPLLKKEWILIPVMIILLGLCFKLYLGNIVNYGSVFPSAEKVISQEKAMKYYGQSQVGNQLIKTKAQRRELLFTNFARRYYYRAQSIILGIMAHQNMPKTARELEKYNNILLLYLFVLLISLKFILQDYRLLVLFSISALYILTVFFVNYWAYQHHFAFSVALQGRYNFPVLASAVSFFSYTFLFRFNERVKYLLVGILALIFIPGGFFYFLSKAGPVWYMN